MNPTATTWAKNQVVPSWAAYQRTVPNAKKIVVAIRIRRETGSRPSAHHAIPTSTAPVRAETARMSVPMPQMATNGTSTIAGSGGNGRSAPAVDGSPVSWLRG